MGYKEAYECLNAPGITHLESKILAYYANKGTKENGFTTFVSQVTVAEHFGVKKQNVYRALKNLKKEGYLSEGYRDNRPVTVIELEVIHNATFNAFLEQQNSTEKSNQNDNPSNQNDYLESSQNDYPSNQNDYREFSKRLPPVIKMITPYKEHLKNTLKNPETDSGKKLLNARGANETTRQPVDNSEPGEEQPIPGQIDVLEETGYTLASNTTENNDLTALAELLQEADPEKERERQLAALEKHPAYIQALREKEEGAA